MSSYADDPSCLKAIHLRHLDIHQHKIILSPSLPGPGVHSSTSLQGGTVMSSCFFFTDPAEHFPANGHIPAIIL